MSYGFQENKLLVPYSENEERAQIINVSDLESSMPRKSKRLSKKRSKKSRRTTKGFKGFKGVKIVHGKLALKVLGYQGVQKLSPSQLIRFIPLNKLKTAAKKVLHLTGHLKSKRKKRKSRKKK